MPERPSILRWNPLLGEWVIISPATDVRPWSGTTVSPVKTGLPEFDPACYLCPGVKRASGQVNPDYKNTFVFDNDFPSLSMNYTMDEQDKIRPQDISAHGICRVICFSPKHNVTLAEMDDEEVATVVRAFRDQFHEVSSLPEIQHVLLFENKGKVIGVSNPHPHGQIYATEFIPRIPSTQYAQAKAFMDKNGTCLFCSIVEEELDDGRHIVSQNKYFVAFVPYFARHSYEILIMPRRHLSYITELSEKELMSLAVIYREILVRYDNLFQMPFPNITIFQNAPCSQTVNPEPFHFYLEFCPPLRSRDKLKYMAGFETGGGNIVNPTLPTKSAEELRSLSTIHYTKSS